MLMETPERLRGGPSVGGAASAPPAQQEPSFWELKCHSAKGFSFPAVSTPAFRCLFCNHLWHLENGVCTKYRDINDLKLYNT